VSTETYEDQGVRFEYPAHWVVEVTEGGPETTVDVQHPDGLAFALVRVDEERPDPAGLADQALEAMRQEYPELEAAPVLEPLREHVATGYDVDFFSLDVSNGARIRSFRTPSRTILIFGQWSDIGDDDLSEQVRIVFRTIEEVEEFEE
jgi:hypothetical protein